MPELIARNTVLWYFLSEDLRELIHDGEMLMKNSKLFPESVSDYSFLVFPIAKAYEGFLKRVLLDMGLIDEEEYFGDDIRIGRLLNPKYIKEHGNVFTKLCDNSSEGRNIVDLLWANWKRGRNSLFHYFPKNYRRISYIEAVEIIEDLIKAMHSVMGHCKA